MAKSKKQIELEQQIGELTQDLQRVRADFENYRKRVEAEKHAAKINGASSAISKLLPMVDNIERAIGHMPANLANDPWAQGVKKLVKNLEKSLSDMNVTRIEASAGTVFDPDLHNAIQFDDDADGDQEIIAEEMQAGYKLHESVLRPAMVKVTRQ